jgi:hypothetical protein
MAREILLSRLHSEHTGADVLICSASYEERSTSVPTHLNPESFRTVLVFRSDRLAETAASAWHSIRRKFTRRAHLVTFDGSNPLSFADAALSALSKRAQNPQRILLDVTSFTHENLLILLALLRFAHPKVPVTIAYSAAGEYLTDGTDWLSRGYSEVRSVLGFPGEMRPKFQEHLIVLVGYETERAERLIRSYEPARLTLGRCATTGVIDERFHDRNVRLHEELSRLHKEVHRFEFACNDPMVARDHILAQVDEHSDHNAVVAPMNTKLSTVGAALAALARPRIQLCYVPSREYNETGYSKPGTKCYLYPIPLD